MSDRQEQLDELAHLVRIAGTDLDEAVKWRRLTFTAGGNWHHWLCAVAASTKGVTLMFHKGALLADPLRLLRGEGRYLRHVSHAAALAHPDEIAALVREAIEHQTDMLP